VIEDILDISKIEAGKLDLDPTDFSPRETIERACGLLARRAHEKDLEFVVAVEPELPAQMHGDTARISQVISNLVTNAIKFTADGEVVVRAAAERREDGSALFRLEVSDTGIGIDPEALETLFDPFSQADGSTTRNYGGTGLGLTISRQLIEMMGGKLSAESELGKGSRFWFELPLPVVEGGDRRPEPERGLAGLRVLVVDDNAANRAILERQLSSWGVDCEGAEDSSLGLERLDAAAAAGKPYELALLDLNMPEVDGHELAREIRARPALQSMRLMLLTSSGGRAEVPDEAAVDGFLTKQVRQSRLYDEIQAVMAGEGSVSHPAQRRGARGERDGEGASWAPLVLVVEDSPVNQTVVTRMLEKYGVRSEVAGDGRLALEALSKGSYAAILMDCQMPELDGYEATREIRRREQGGQHTPIIAMTASSMAGDRERCLAAGMDDYLSKPLRAPAVRDTVRRWVRQSPDGPDPTGPGPNGGQAVASNAEPGTGEGPPPILDEAVIADLGDLEPDDLGRLLSLYLEESSSQLSELRQAVGRGEAPTVEQLAHKLKGSSSAVGAARVARIGDELEARAEAGDLGDAEELLDRLESALEESKSAFRSSNQLPSMP